MIAFLIFIILLEAAIIAWLADQQGRERSRVTLAWLMSMKDKDSDLRAMTEALLRAEGKAIIFPRRGPLEPSPGWLDRKKPEGPPK